MAQSLPDLKPPEQHLPFRLHRVPLQSVNNGGRTWGEAVASGYLRHYVCDLPPKLNCGIDPCDSRRLIGSFAAGQIVIETRVDNTWRD